MNLSSILNFIYLLILVKKRTFEGTNVYVGHTHTDFKTGIEKPVVSKMETEDFTLSSPITSFSLDLTAVDISASGSILVAGAM